MKRTVYVRCDAGTRLGMGHLVRCLSLSHMIRNYFNVQFVLQETDATAYEWVLSNGFTYLTLPATTHHESDSANFIIKLSKSGQPGDLVVLDGYQFQTSYQKKLVDAGYKVVAIDDLHSWHHAAHLVINHAPGISPQHYDIANNTRLLLGSAYALLRPEILKAASEHREIRPVQSAIISMGASDADNCTLFFAEILAEHFPALHIHLLVSSINPHLNALHQFSEDHCNTTSLHINLTTSELVKLLQSADAVICPASTISLEACATGCSIITGYTADNQLGILAGLTSVAAAISLGCFQTLNPKSTRQQIKSFVEDLSLRQEQYQHQRALIDAKSRFRLALHMLEISRSASHRKATLEDVQLLFAWANDAAVRANSFQSEPIVWENHVQWYSKALETAAIAIWIYSINNLPAAQIRLKVEDNTATINYSVASNFRGQGLGTWLLQHICLLVKIENPRIQHLQGWVKKENIGSVKAFERSGFIIAEDLEDRLLFKFQLDML
ncbi:MAG: UDP-2,4-diacetamido-2,4,6-trideoxy-beta-L-altropyranose hydrolase [Flavobacteriales bacterium]